MEIVSIGGPKPKDTLSAPIDHLLACHRRIEQKLDLLVRALDGPGDEIANVFHFFDTNGALHTQDEEESIFPRLTPRVSASETALLNALHAEHETIEALYARVASGERTSETVRELADRYRTHIAREEAELIPLLQAYFDGGDLLAISKEMKQRRGL
jgi:hemerythrin-like domain-containing protein